MNMPVELDYLLTLSQSGIKNYAGAEAMNAAILEWFDTPMFSLADNVKWGNTLQQFQFDPIDDVLEVEMEMVVAQKIRQDISGLVLRSIRIDSGDNIDSIVVYMLHNFGEFSDQIQFRESL